jgi:hypothetical protein
VRLIVEPNGRLSGSRANEKLSGTWEFRGEYFCRSFFVGGTVGQDDCQVVYLDDNGITIIRQKGHGTRARYQFADLNRRPESSPDRAANSTATGDTSRLLSDWRQREEIVRKAIMKKHYDHELRAFQIGEFEIRSATADADNRQLVILATEYTLESIPGLGFGVQPEPERYQLTILVNNDTESVVDIGNAKRIN